ncbi:MAG TPA: MFS transporter [Terracidiphilus sp.]|nr:MFS transporter [Terracidiphilus sp.]
MSRRQWTVVLLLTASVIVNYVDRSNLSIAATLVQRQLGLSPLQIGTLLSAFFWSYAFLQLCGLVGFITDRLPVGWVMAGGYAIWSVATVVIGLMSSFTTMFLALLLLGAGESVAYPCYSRIFAKLPEHQRGKANALIDAGTKLGPAAGAFVGGLLLAHVGWRMLFIALGAGGLLWLVPWLRFMPGDESRDHAATAAESASFAKMLRLRCAWGTFFGHFCGNYFFYYLLTWLPVYFVHEQKMSIISMSRITSSLFLLIATSTATAGWISDRLIGRGVSATCVRLSVASGGLGLASSLIALAFIHHNRPLSLAILAVASIGYGAFASNHWAITQTLAGPTFAGRWSSLQNGVANLSGIIAPWTAGLIVQLNGSSRMAFAVTGAVALAGALDWGLIVRRVEPVRWNTLRCTTAP